MNFNIILYLFTFFRQQNITNTTQSTQSIYQEQHNPYNAIINELFYYIE